MSILIIDTETTGVNPREARLVQLAVYHMRAEPPFEFIEQLNEIVRPDGFEIPEGAAAIHGITTAEATRRGISLIEALTRLVALGLNAKRLIAHNMRYDYTVAASELTRVGFDPQALSSLRPFCTMLAMTERCAIPHKRPRSPYSRDPYKWPRLDEAYRHCFGEPPDDATRHTAMGDVLTCRDIFIHGVTQGWWH